MIRWTTTMTAAPLDLTVDRQGGVTGLAPTVALRDTATNGYLDWADATFKTSGWATRYAAMSAVERGHYQLTLNLSATPAVVAGMVLVAEYHVDNGADVVGDAHDYVAVEANQTADIALMRKALTNRLEETSGNPGVLRLYDDDGSTVLKTWPLCDEGGGAVLPAVGTAARRDSDTHAGLRRKDRRWPSRRASQRRLRLRACFAGHRADAGLGRCDKGVDAHLLRSRATRARRTCGHRQGHARSEWRRGGNGDQGRRLAERVPSLDSIDSRIRILSARVPREGKPAYWGCEANAFVVSTSFRSQFRDSFRDSLRDIICRATGGHRRAPLRCALARPHRLCARGGAACADCYAAVSWQAGLMGSAKLV